MSRRPPRPRRPPTVHGDRRSPPTSLWRSPLGSRRSGSTAQTCIGSRAGRRNKDARSWYEAKRTAATPTSRRSPATRAPGCMNTAADPGPSPTALSIFPISPTAASIGRSRRAGFKPAPTVERRGSPGAAHPCAADPRARLEVCRWRDRSSPALVDWGARGSHRRRRAGQCHRCRGSGPSRRRSRLRARGGTRLLLFAAALPGRQVASVACLGPPEHALERHHSLYGADRRQRRSR